MFRPELLTGLIALMITSSFGVTNCVNTLVVSITASVPITSLMCSFEVTYYDASNVYMSRESYCAGTTTLLNVCDDTLGFYFERVFGKNITSYTVTFNGQQAVYNPLQYSWMDEATHDLNHLKNGFPVVNPSVCNHDMSIYVAPESSAYEYNLEIKDKDDNIWIENSAFKTTIASRTYINMCPGTYSLSVGAFQTGGLGATSEVTTYIRTKMYSHTLKEYGQLDVTYTLLNEGTSTNSTSYSNDGLDDLAEAFATWIILLIVAGVFITVCCPLFLCCGGVALFARLCGRKPTSPVVAVIAQ